MSALNAQQHSLRAGMIGMGMIFDETYRPMFEALHADGLYRRDFGYVDVALTAVATRTGARARRIQEERRRPDRGLHELRGCRQRRAGDRGGRRLRLRRLAGRPPFRRREAGHPGGTARADREALGAPAPAAGRARRARAGKAASWPRSSTTSSATRITRSCARSSRTASCSHVNNGYCSLLEPKSICDRAVRGVDRGTQSRHLRRRPLHQAD